MSGNHLEKMKTHFTGRVNGASADDTALTSDSGDATIDSLVASLRDSDPRTRMRAIMGLADKKDIPLHALREVVRLVHDKGEYDPNPGSLALIKYVPTVEGICRLCLPRIAQASPLAVHALIREYARLDELGQSQVGDALLIVGPKPMQAVIGAAEEGERQSLRLLLDMILFARWTTPEAKACFSVSGRQTPYLQPALDLLRNGLFGKAVADLREVAKAHPEDPFCLALLARALEESGAPDEAASAWQDAAATQTEPVIAEWARRQAQRVNAASDKAREALRAADLATIPVSSLREHLQRSPAELLSRVVLADPLPKNFVCAFKACPPCRVASWGPLFTEGSRDPRLVLLKKIATQQRSRWLRAATAASVLGVILVLASIATSIWRIGIENEPWLVNPAYLFAAIVGVAATAGVWATAVTWENLAGAVTTSMSEGRGPRLAKRLATLYVITLVASVVLSFAFALSPYAPSKPSTYKFDRWGIAFSYPSEFQSITDPYLEQLRKATESQLAGSDRTLEELKVFEVSEDDVSLMVSKIKTDTPLSIAQVLRERQGVYDAAREAGDVTKLNLLRQTTVGSGTKAVIEDAERSDGSRGRSYKIPQGDSMFEVSFVFTNKALFEKYSAKIDSIIASLRMNAGE